MKAIIRQLEKYLAPIFLAAFIGALGYWYWTTTPSYALSQIVISFNNHDVKTFEKYVDIDRLVDKAIDDFIEGPAKKSNIFKGTDSMLGIGIIYLFKDELIDIAKEQVEMVISRHNLELSSSTSGLDGCLNALLNSFSAKAVAANIEIKQTENKTDLGIVPSNRSRYILDMAHCRNIHNTLDDYGFSYKYYRGIDYLNINGNKGHLGLKFYSPKLSTTYTIELLMENSYGHWRIVELSNLADLVDLFTDSKTEPAIR